MNIFNICYQFVSAIMAAFHPGAFTNIYFLFLPPQPASFLINSHLQGGSIPSVVGTSATFSSSLLAWRGGTKQSLTTLLLVAFQPPTVGRAEYVSQ